jgi:GNAT superfamily N-acetyltransferase
MPPLTTTYLEMRSAGELRPKRCPDAPFWVRECTVPQWPFNRFLYLTVGAPWAWNDKRGWSDEQWRAYVESDRLRSFAAYYDGSPAGYYELHRGDNGDVEIAYFGLLPAFLGRGFGGALLTSALEEAWKSQPPRVWVHTCTLDHPAALANYRARGMRVHHVETCETPGA